MVNIDTGADNTLTIKRDALYTFKRVSDGKPFKASELLHWTPVKAEDGEEDLIKFAFPDGEVERFVGFDSGHSFERRPISG